MSPVVEAIGQGDDRREIHYQSGCHGAPSVGAAENSFSGRGEARVR
jgi:hypothetical protein